MGIGEPHAQEKTSAMNKTQRTTINSGGTRYTNHTDLSRLSSVKVNRKDLLKQIAWKIKRSQIFLSLYIILIIGNATLLYLSFQKQDSHWIFSAIEGFFNFVYLLEIAVGILTNEAYFSKCSNLVDVIICLACWALFGFFLEEECIRKKYQPDIASEIAVDLLEARYVVQTLRICRYMKTACVARRYFDQEDVKFQSSITTDMLSELLV